MSVSFNVDDFADKYEILMDRDVPDLSSRGVYLRHKKSGARVMVLSNDDENKVFCIGFRTPVSDSTGVPHIIEHTVLCGSDKYPGKDPFVELVKGSLNTFLNAMTYPDKTVFPVASCNDTDFKNLMSVYMDAVFHPNIYKTEKIFRQEGWHYELDDPDGELIINGVVYNEMKGAFSSVDGVLDRVILNSLFPDTTYANESGGDPEVIPTLTYEQYLDFHRTYYHPSNSYIYLYGDMDVAERLKWIDEEYLSGYERKAVSSRIQLQKPFSAPVRVEKEYSISQGEDERDNTYLALNKVIGTSLDRKLYRAFEIIEYAILTSAGAPLKQALLNAGIGTDIDSSYDNGVLQPMFSVIAKGANPEDEEKFLSVIDTELRRLAEEGIDKKALEAGINYYEFKFREADFGPYPKGLMYGLQTYDSWLYNDSLPLIHIEALDTYKFLRDMLTTNYYEDLIRTYLIDNTHASLVVIRPKKGLSSEIEEASRRKLAEYKASLSKEEIERLIRETKELKAFQEAPDSKEDLDKIPVLKISDIRKTVEKIPLEEKECGNQKILYTKEDTNGIGYLTMEFSMEKVPARLIPYVGLLSRMLCYVDTASYRYQDLYNEINLKTGGIAASTTLYGNSKKSGQFTPVFAIRSKALYSQMEDALRLIGEIIYTSRMDDEKRLKEIVDQCRSSLSDSLLSAGHAAAAKRALSYLSPLSAYGEQLNGITYYQMIEELSYNFDDKKAQAIANLKELMEILFIRDNLQIHYTAQEEGLAALAAKLDDLVMKTGVSGANAGQHEGTDAGANAGQASARNLSAENKDASCEYPVPVKKNEGFLTASKVQYVASAGNFINAGFAYTGALRILKVMLSYDYLWINIRVKGGAYGCMSSFSRTGDSYLVTYRDPNLGASKEIFGKTGEYLRNFAADDKTMNKYIIGTISDLDTPLNPSAKGAKALSMYRNDLTWEDLQRERNEVLEATCEDIRKLADLVDSVMACDAFCCIGNEDKILSEKELFAETKHLFGAKAQ